MPRKNILFVSEFGASAFDGIVASACRETARRFPSSRTCLITGFLTRYTYGGLRPSRLLNYAVVFARSLMALIRFRPEVVVVDTSPPLIQWWLAWLAPYFGARVFVWLMDYHPEIEARFLSPIYGLRWMASCLRVVDRHMLRRVSGVIALDPAMAETVRNRCPQLPVLVHPTWSEQGTGGYKPVTLNNDPTEFRLVYIGNLGVSHGVADLEQLLAKIRTGCAVKLLAVGGNAGGRALLRQLSVRLNITCELFDRLPWEELHNRVNAFRPNYAVVLMDGDKRGLLSPSKYSSYLQLGLPVLYLGPRDTNADLACRQQGAGLAATHSESLANNKSLVESLLDPQIQLRCQSATQSAFLTLQGLNAKTFVDLLYPWISPICS
jgi:hypothetical protein